MAEAWCLAGRRSTRAVSSRELTSDPKDLQRLGLVWAFKTHLQWHTSSSKVTVLILPTVNQLNPIFHWTSLWVLSHSNHHSPIVLWLHWRICLRLWHWREETQGILRTKHGANFADWSEEQVPRGSFSTVQTFPFSNGSALLPFKGVKLKGRMDGFRDKSKQHLGVWLVYSEVTNLHLPLSLEPDCSGRT